MKLIVSQSAPNSAMTENKNWAEPRNYKVLLKSRWTQGLVWCGVEESFRNAFSCSPPLTKSFPPPLSCCHGSWLGCFEVLHLVKNLNWGPSNSSQNSILSNSETLKQCSPFWSAAEKSHHWGVQASKRQWKQHISCPAWSACFKVNWAD